MKKQVLLSVRFRNQGKKKLMQIHYTDANMNNEGISAILCEETLF